MKEYPNLPRVTGTDLVTRILTRRDAKRAALERQRNLARKNRCFGTNSCDCPRCR